VRYRFETYVQHLQRPRTTLTSRSFFSRSDVQKSSWPARNAILPKTTGDL
jgi:hypothetical protein